MAKKEKKVFSPETGFKTSIKIWYMRHFVLEFIKRMRVHSPFQGEITDKKHLFG